MDFTLTDGQKKLVSAFRTFGADTFTPERVAKWCRDQGLPDTVMKEFVDLYYELSLIHISSFLKNLKPFCHGSARPLVRGSPVLERLR